MTSLEVAAVAAGAEVAPAYEFNGQLEAATYTVTAAQLQAVVARATARLLAAMDGMDRGCMPWGFRGHQNGYGEESAGDELQTAPGGVGCAGRACCSGRGR